jgi:hypothetical protein
MSIETIALVSAGVGAVGSLVAGVSQAGQARRAAKVADANASEAVRQGEAEAGLIRERARRLRGSNRAAAGASGVDISSFADALDDSDISSELDALTTIRNAKMQANNFKAEARASRSGSGAALAGGLIGAGTQALSGFGNWKLLKTMTPSSGNFGWTSPIGGHGGAR